jgi:hypothetical protein
MSAAPEPVESTAVAESRFHNYRGNAIPWYVRLIWIGFWAFAIFYCVRFLFPAMQREIAEPLVPFVVKP